MTAERKNIFFWIYAFLLCFVPVLAVMSGNIYGSAPVLCFLLALGVWQGADKSKIKIDYALLAIIAALPLLAAVSTLWAVAPGKIIIKSAKEMALFLSAFGVFSLAPLLDADQRTRLFRFFPVCFVVAMLLLFEELLLGHPLFRLMKQIPFDDKVIPSVVNHGAVALSLLYWPFLYLMIQHGKALHAVATGVFFFVFLILLSQSETAMVACVAGAITFAFATYLPRLTLWVALLKVTVISFTAPFFFPWAYRHFVEDIATWRSANAGARLDIWNTVSEYALRNPLYGHGMEASRNITDFTFGPYYSIREFISHPHNNVLQLWIEFGALGAIWAAVFFAFVLLRLRKLERMEYAISLACFAGCFTVALVGYGLWQAWWAGLILLTATTLRVVFTPKTV